MGGHFAEFYVMKKLYEEKMKIEEFEEKGLKSEEALQELLWDKKKGATKWFGVIDLS